MRMQACMFLFLGFTQVSSMDHGPIVFYAVIDFLF